MENKKDITLEDILEKLTKEIIQDEAYIMGPDNTEGMSGFKRGAQFVIEYIKTNIKS
jgi:hypothetical protein